MPATAETLRTGLVWFLAVAGSLIGLLLLALIAQRGIRTVLWWRQRHLQRRYGPIIDALFREAGPWQGAMALAAAPRAHRRVIGRLLIEPLRALTGEPVVRARSAAHVLGLARAWLQDLGDARWWRRAEAALSLGFLQEPDVLAALTRLLDDPHEEVRAAAAEALGRLGDTRAVTPLLARLVEQSRHQCARILDAVTMLGNAGAPQVLAHARAMPAHLPMLADLIASVAGSSAVPDLLAWCEAPDAGTRAGAMQALGTIGVDERSFYFALRALEDPDEAVRATAARALGRSGRADAVPYLARHLDDAWVVAAASARGLSALGDAGMAVLQRRSSGDDDPAQLSRQMLWEQRATP